jgi:hypothetical protein
MIPILPATAWREYRGGPPKKGLNQTTHKAMIADPTGRLHHCYVKICPSNFPTPLTEALGWLLAEALDLPRPKFAALVMVPLNKLRQHLPLDQHWLNYPETLAFCSSVVDGETASQGWKWSAHLRTAKIYKRPEVARISAFDHWVDNQDRNTGNLIVNSDGLCTPIDNEFILYSLLWHGNVPFSVNHNSLLAEAKKHLRGETFDRFAMDMAHQSKLHEAALSAAAPKLQQLVNSIVPPQHASTLWSNIQQYLVSRAQPDWLANELGVIV